MADENISDQEAREQRAARLRGKIESIKKGQCNPSGQAVSPRDFLNQKMRERYEQENRDEKKQESV